MRNGGTEMEGGEMKEEGMTMTVGARGERHPLFITI